MPELKLAKLPDRIPVKISISVNPDLYAALTAYADAYQTAYGSAETVAELIPYMLAAYIDGDSGFRKARRVREAAASDGDNRPAPRSRREIPATISAPPSMIPKDNV
jgi:hypothetical protein